jgi:hypothetical protein
MDLISSTVTTTAVATIYVIYSRYRDYVEKRVDKNRGLRERVTYMLWCAAQQI